MFANIFTIVFIVIFAMQQDLAAYAHTRIGQNSCKRSALSSSAISGPTTAATSEACTYPHVVIPSACSCRSATCPTPGTFLTGSPAMKSTTVSRSAATAACPLGLLMSEHILASMVLGPMPTLHVSLVTCCTCCRSSAATFGCEGGRRLGRWRGAPSDCQTATAQHNVEMKQTS